MGRTRLSIGSMFQAANWRQFTPSTIRKFPV